MTHHETLAILRVREEFEVLKKQYDSKLNELTNLIRHCDHTMPDGSSAMVNIPVTLPDGTVYGLRSAVCQLCDEDEIPF